MEADRQRNFEATQKSRRRSPLDRSGGVHDIFFAAVLIVVFSSWLFIVLFVIFTGDGKSISWHIEITEDENVWKEIAEMIFMRLGMIGISITTYFQSSLTAIGIGLQLTITSASAIVTLGYFAPKILCKLGVVALFILIFYYIHELIRRWVLVLGRHPSMINGFDYAPILVVKIIYAFIGAIYVSRMGVADMSDTVKRITGTIFRCCYLFAFSVLIFASIIGMFVLTFYATKLSGTTGSTIKIVMMLAAICEVVYLGLAIYFYGLAVMCEVVATHEWAENNSEIPCCLLFDCMYHVGSKKLGSIAYTSTVIGPFFSGCLAWYRSRRTRPLDLSQKLDFVSEIIVMFFLVQYTAIYSIVMASIEPRSISEATLELFKLFKKNGRKAYSFLWVLYGIQIIVFVVMSFCFALPGGVLKLMEEYDPDLEDSLAEKAYAWLIFYLTSMLTIFILTQPIIMVVDSIGLTTHFSKLKDKVEDNDPKEVVSMIPLHKRNLDWTSG